MTVLIAFCKPFGVLCQFSPDQIPPVRQLQNFIPDTRSPSKQLATDNSTPTLANYIDIPDIYPAGRLDKDSEGLMLLTDNGILQNHISHPSLKMPKTYWVQVEGEPDEQAIQQLCQGVKLKDGLTAPAKVKLMPEPDIWPRDPPVRYRANIPTRWLEVTLKEGRNRQVRRMTAAVGYPTLRLIRYAIGNWTLDNMQPGQWRKLAVDQDYLKQEHSKNDHKNKARKKTAHKSLATSRHRRRYHQT
ncbi:MAG: pseudouridine synthase [Gammaproteobacteria bacterium]|nr:pseudouridine synthase [Gammaproteobacteria bacterium]